MFSAQQWLGHIDTGNGIRRIERSRKAGVLLLVRPDDPTLVASVVVHQRGVAGKLQQPARSFANGAESMRHLEA